MDNSQIYSEWKTGVTISQLASRHGLDEDDVHEFIDLEVEREDALLEEMSLAGVPVT